MNILLSLLGFLGTVATIVGPIIAVISFIVWLVAGKERKKTFGKIALTGVGFFVGGLALIILSMVLLTLTGTPNREEAATETPEIIDTEPDQPSELYESGEIPFITEID